MLKAIRITNLSVLILIRVDINEFMDSNDNGLETGFCGFKKTNLTKSRIWAKFKSYTNKKNRFLIL